MKNSIYYFSGTGNSLKIAQDLASELGNTELISIAKSVNSKLNLDFDIIGIVFPVYMWGLPLIVRDFLKNVKNSKSYFFAVATYGGLPGSTLDQAVEILKSNGVKLSAGFAVRMPGNYTPMYGAFPLSKQNRFFKKAAEKVKIIAEYVKLKKENKAEKSLPFINWLLSKKFYNFASPHIPEMDKNFWADEKCTGCGICYRICPAANIKLVNGRPVWLHKCQQCMGCLQWCPVEAIQYKKNTVMRKRYHHPQLKAEDFFMR
ncbi:MAG: EFR1 family ferrodoxin [Elusimicrobia bacterium]|nr:EFR1 family ferrodoxin [Elusimicrobiota bacterium]